MECYSAIKSHTIDAHINPGEPQGRDICTLKITEAVYFSFNLHRLVCSSLMVLLLIFTYISGLLSFQIISSLESGIGLMILILVRIWINALPIIGRNGYWIKMNELLLAMAEALPTMTNNDVLSKRISSTLDHVVFTCMW